MLIPREDWGIEMFQSLTGSIHTLRWMFPPRPVERSFNPSQVQFTPKVGGKTKEGVKKFQSLTGSIHTRRELL